VLAGVRGLERRPAPLPVAAICDDGQMGATIWGDRAKPTHCPAGHELKAPLLTLGWLPCACPEALGNFNGHHFVTCLREGCRRTTYVPPHDPAGDVTPPR